MLTLGKDHKENSMVGKAFMNGSDLLCAVPTGTAVAVSEQPELRAYKLGKQKCSYNQVELLFYDVTGEQLKVSEAIETCVGADVEDVLRESCLKFNVRFFNSARVHLYIYLVYARAEATLAGKYYWLPVTRARCTKGCSGPVLRGLQRFGKMSKRSCVGVHEGNVEDTWKEPRNLYVAIDEASTHVCTGPEIPRFRLLLAAYNDRYELLGTTVSTAVRVLANNDAPLGAASFKVHFHLQGGFEQAPPSGPLQTGQPALREIESVTGEAQNLDTEGHMRDSHSLNQLCERIFEICLSRVDSVVSLRTLAALLGTRRKRIYEIFNVLQCIQVVELQGEEKYTWHGGTRISQALKKLKEEARISQKSSRMRKFRHLSEEMAENPMRELAERFIQLFFVDKERSITLEFAIEAILDDHNDPQTHRCKIRRLTEIARILTVLNLIGVKNSGSNDGFSTGSSFSWRGVRGVQERLETAASRPLNPTKILKRRGPRLNSKRKDVECKNLPFENAENETHCMPGLVSESEDDVVPLPSLEMECNRLIKRPRPCARATETDWASVLLKKPTPASSNPTRNDGSSSSPEKERHGGPDHNDVDAVNLEAAAMLISLSSSEQPRAIDQRSPQPAKINHKIQAETTPKPSTSAESSQFHPSNSLTEICSKSSEVATGYPNSVEHFNPLHQLQQVFSPSQIADMQAENPGFLADFVMYSTQLYQKWCAEKFADNHRVNLYNPVPRFGAVDIANLAGHQEQM